MELFLSVVENFTLQLLVGLIICELFFEVDRIDNCLFGLVFDEDELLNVGLGKSEGTFS